MGDDKRPGENARLDHPEILPEGGVDDLSSGSGGLANPAAECDACLAQILVQRPSLAVPGCEVNFRLQESNG